VRDEDEQGVYDDWCRVVDECGYDYEWYLRPDGQLHLEAKPESLFKKTTEAKEENE
jgi:hypothetical protein